MSKSGRILMTPELGREYNLVDVDGKLFYMVNQHWNWIDILDYKTSKIDIFDF